jgi:hypothetical protein
MTKFWLLNFILLQWFCIRLVRKMEKSNRIFPKNVYAIEYVQVGWTVIFVLPLTGWWSDYIWIWRRN